MPERWYTRDRNSMQLWARYAHASELRATRDEAQRESDRELVTVIEHELRRRGLIEHA